MTNTLNKMARLIFQAAIDEDKCGELFECLIEGGSATVDVRTRKLVLFTKEQLDSVLTTVIDDET